MAPALTVLSKTQSPVTFTRNGGNLTNDAEFTGTARSAGGNLDARVEVRIPCGATQEVYVALASAGGGAVLQNLEVTAEPLVGCMFPVPDAGMMPEPDAGMMEADAGTGSTETKRLAFAGTVQQPTAVTGCGCTSLDGTAAVALIGLVGLLRRRTRR
jgi:uncharacterized protein (TIGR03382 family)